ncbi:MAG: hypothetical protein ABIV63_16705, partial [Caldimonas sp.]
YEDVQYPWIQVQFDELIDPAVALRCGRQLAAVMGADRVHFNSLRPRAVVFLLAPAFEAQPSFKASRYGEPLAAVDARWSGALASRSGGSSGRGAARPPARKRPTVS